MGTSGKVQDRKERHFVVNKSTLLVCELVPGGWGITVFFS